MKYVYDLPCSEFQERLQQADTFIIPKGRLAPAVLGYLDIIGFATADVEDFKQSQIIYGDNQRLIFMPDAEIGRSTYGLPRAIGFTAAHQQIEHTPIPLDGLVGSQLAITLTASRYAIASRPNDTDRLLEMLATNEEVFLCTEYPRTADMILDYEEISAKIAHVAPGCSEVLLGSSNHFDGALVITETSKTLDRNNNLKIVKDDLGQIEIAGLWN